MLRPMKSLLHIVPAALAAAAAAEAGVALQPIPATLRVELVETLHGERVSDPYRWLEGSADPAMARPDPMLDNRVRAWSGSQNARTRAYLDALPGRDAVRARLRELFGTESVSAPVVRGERVFYTRRRGVESNGVLYVRDGDGPERELLNVNRLYPDGRTSLAYFSPSRDGRLVAFGVFKSGDELTTLRVLDATTGRWLADTISGRAGAVEWLPAGDAFVYARLAEVRDPYSHQIRFHRLGDDPLADRVIFEQYRDGPLAGIGGPFASLDRSGRRLLLGYARGWGRNDLWVCDFEHWRRTGELRRTPVAEGRDAAYVAHIVGEDLYLFTTEGAPEGRLVKTPVALPGRENWRTLARGTAANALVGFAVAGDRLVTEWRREALTAYEVGDLEGASPRELTLPGIGVATLVTDESSPVAYLSYSALNLPPTTYRVDLRTDVRSVYFASACPVDPSRLMVTREYAVSKDGTRVPLFLLHRRELKRDGSNPTILWGYGGFAVAQKPAFSPSILPWVEAGGVYVVSGLRGGDEYGEPWHRAGMLANKQRVFDDFVAAAESLIAKGYATPGRLGVRGGSNGGLLTGAMLTQRPDLIGAAQVAVPLLDMVRYPKFLMARSWIPEYGDPAREADFRWIFPYSPYHRVRPGVAYPATLLEAGENDTRVHPLHARKMAAALQSATGGDASPRPILLKVDFDSGHGAGRSFEMRVNDSADSLLFFGTHLGLRFPVAPAVK